YFLTVLQDTAAGNDEVSWADQAWYECIGNLLFLMWVFGCAAALATGSALALGPVLPLSRLAWWLAVAGLTQAFFPVFLLSSLAAGTPWLIINPYLWGK